MIEKLKEYYVVIGLVIVFTMGWGSHVLYSQSVAKDVEDYREEIARVNAQEIAKLKVENTTVQGKIIERIKTEVVYSECKQSDEDYKLLTENW